MPVDNPAAGVAATDGHRGPRWRDPRLIAVVLLPVVFVAGAAVVPHLGADQIRSWAQETGPWLPLVFFTAHAAATIVLPRIAFTLSAGLLFGPVTGVAVAIAATTVSAVVAFQLVRVVGREAVAARLLTHPAVAAVDRRLARRGWLAVGSLRLIGPVPFALINYCAGLSSVRLAPYLVATVVGVLPGTIAVVALGDALTGHTSPALLATTVACAAIGAAGLLADARLGADEPVTNAPTTTAAGATSGPACSSAVAPTAAIARSSCRFRVRSPR
ncbi:TVP38/TMEM64 family protein [Nocardia sp. NPDC051900]|uniref:TVP38/TMEM64 family protein n=1 Tax=Nocardia sp. NPDC051900 TaxID=3364326 RepID=UPI0037B2C61C